jgi:quercetin dioxygenase-like cupin family protein
VIRSSKFPVIEHKVFYFDPKTGMATLLFWLAPGAVVPLHGHTGVELTYVLEGSLEDEESECTAGNFVWRPAGNAHEARAPRGTLLLDVFMSPNHFAAGQVFPRREPRLIHVSGGRRPGRYRRFAQVAPPGRATR